MPPACFLNGLSNPIRLLRQKKNAALRRHFFWRRRRDLFAFCLWQNYGSAPSSRRRRQSTGLSHLIIQIPLPYPHIKTTPIRRWVLFLWRRRRDLNPRYPFGVYTISNRARSASYATSPSFAISLHIILHLTGFVNPYFSISQTYSQFFFITPIKRKILNELVIR